MILLALAQLLSSVKFSRVAAATDLMDDRGFRLPTFQYVRINSLEILEIEVYFLDILFFATEFFEGSRQLILHR